MPGVEEARAPGQALGNVPPSDTDGVLLAEWRTWWSEHGERELHDLLQERWDPFGDESFRASAAPELFRLARNLHEGATLVDVQTFLNDLRRRQSPERTGHKWFNRDRAVARRVIAWYEQTTGETRR